MYFTMDEQRAEATSVFHQFGDKINESLHTSTNSSQFDLKSVDDVASLLGDLKTDGYWDDIFSNLPTPAKKQNFSNLVSSSQRAVEGLAAITECSEAFERFYDKQEQLLEFMRVPANQADEISRVASTNYDEVKEFSKSPSYWNEVVRMEAENGQEKELEILSNTSSSKSSTSHKSAIQGLGARDALDIIGQCAAAQETLSTQVEKIRHLCKNDGTTEVDLCTVADNSIIEPDSVHVPFDALKTLITSTEDESFYPELLKMQEEADCNGTMSLSGISARNSVSTSRHEQAISSSCDTDQPRKVTFLDEGHSSSTIEANNDNPSVGVGIASRVEIYSDEKEITDIDERGHGDVSVTEIAQPTRYDGSGSKATTSGALIIPTTSLLEDLEVMALKPQKQIGIDNKVAVSMNPLLSQLQEEIDLRSLRGPNIQFCFTILLIAAVSIALISYSNSVRESPWLFRILWVLAYAINFIAVSFPGRLDRVIVGGEHIKPWNSLFEAATWAFALWGVVYGSEIILSGYISIIGIPMKLFQKLVPYWLASNWFQGLWCFTFRPEFKAHLWIPTLFLALGTCAFAKMHLETTLFLRSYEGAASFGILLLRIPFAIHASWLAAATLLNFNSFAAVSQMSKGMQIALAHASALMAAICGVLFAVYTNDCVVAFTIAWALAAVANRSTEKSKLSSGVFPSEIHESIAASSHVLANVTTCIGFGILVAPYVGQAAH